MSEVTYETLLHRIERLESSNLVMKFIALGAIIISVAFNAFPAMSSVFPHGPKQLDAERYNLVSPKGSLLATFGQTANGAYMSFYDTKGNLEMNLGAGAPDVTHPTNTSIGIAIYDGNALLPRSDSKPGVARMVWAGDATAGVPTVFGESIFDANAKVRLSDATAGDGSNGGSFFYDASQTLRASVGLGANGPGAAFYDSTGTARLLEGVAGNDSSASFSIMNSGATRALYDLSAAGDGSATTFQVKDENGAVRVTEGYSTMSDEIVLLDNAAGIETFRAPCTGAACP